MSRIDDLRNELADLETEEALSDTLGAAKALVYANPDKSEHQTALKNAAAALRLHRASKRFGRSLTEAEKDLVEAETEWDSDPTNLDLAVAVHAARGNVARIKNSVTVAPAAAGAKSASGKVVK